MLFSITKRGNIRVKWRDWTKEYIRQIMIWQLQMQHTIGMFHFGEQPFIAVCSAKHVHLLLCVGDKVGESSRSTWFLQKSRIWQARNLDFESSKYWRSASSICHCPGTSSRSTSKDEEEIFQVRRATDVKYQNKFVINLSKTITTKDD